MTTRKQNDQGTLTPDAHGVKIHHLTYGVTLFARHGVCHVVKADPRGTGRPPRVLCSIRIRVGFLDLVGLTSMDASHVVAEALAGSLARPTDIGPIHAVGTGVPLGTTGGTVTTRPPTGLENVPLPGLE